MKGKYSVFGDDPFYDFNNDGKLDALEAGFQLHGEQMEDEVIFYNRPLSYVPDLSTPDLFGEDQDDDLDDDLDDDF